MEHDKFVAYYRVSTSKQDRSGLGLEAQRATVHAFMAARQAALIQSFTEVETGKGANALSQRPQLREALAMCKRESAILIIAKLDRLARNVHFVSGLLESGCEFVAADMPSANKVMIQMHAVMSEWERDQISLRTKAALQAAKARGVRLGLTGSRNLGPHIEQRERKAQAFAEKVAPIIKGLLLSGLTQREVVRQLNASGIRAARGGDWHLVQLQRVLQRLSVPGSTA